MPKHIKNKYKFTVQPEEFERPNDLSFMIRFDRFLNMSEIARSLPTCSRQSTLVSRLDRGTKLDQDVDQKAFANDIGELFNEIFWEIGVGLGHFPNDPHKKYRFIYNDDSERLKDVLTDIDPK